MVRYRVLFEIANSAHTLATGGSQLILVLFVSQSDPGVALPVFSVNKSKFDSRMNAAAYMMPSMYIRLAESVRQIWKEEY